MLSPDLASILCYLCSLRRYWSVLCWNPCQLFQVSKTRDVFGQNLYFDFAELCPFRKIIGNAIDFILFCKKMNRKRINNGFGTKIEIENIQLFWNNLLASLLKWHSDFADEIWFLLATASIFKAFCKLIRGAATECYFLSNATGWTNPKSL